MQFGGGPPSYVLCYSAEDRRATFYAIRRGTAELRSMLFGGGPPSYVLVPITKHCDYDHSHLDSPRHAGPTA